MTLSYPSVSYMLDRHFCMCLRVRACVRACICVCVGKWPDYLIYVAVFSFVHKEICLNG